MKYKVLWSGPRDNGEIFGVYDSIEDAEMVRSEWLEVMNENGSDYSAKVVPLSRTSETVLFATRH